MINLLKDKPQPISLLDALQTIADINPNKLIYLGAKDGCAFFDVATVSQMLEPGYLKRLSQARLDQAKRYARDNFTKVKNAIGFAMPNKHQNLWYENVKTKLATFEKSFNNLKNFEPLLKRNIVDVHPRLSDSGLIVIVTGYEFGEYYFLSEKERKMQREKPAIVEDKNAIVENESIESIAEKENIKLKVIPGFPNYSISNDGRVYSEKRHMFLVPIEQDGYLKYDICDNGVKKRVSAHRLVAEAFIPNPHNFKFVTHINGIKTDNRVCNLEWCERNR